MQGYWIKFTDGSAGYCDGQSTYDAVRISEKLTGKKAVVGGDDKYRPELDKLPYPASPVIWQREWLDEMRIAHMYDSTSQVSCKDISEKLDALIGEKA